MERYGSERAKPLRNFTVELVVDEVEERWLAAMLRISIPGNGGKVEIVVFINMKPCGPHEEDHREKGKSGQGQI
jgi:hypothetical protein